MIRIRSFLCALLVVACSEPPTGEAPDASMRPTCGAPEPGPARAVFVLPRGGGAFFDLPWPTDLRRTPAGSLDVSGFPNVRNNDFVSRYLDAMEERLDGFATNGSIYFRFSRTVDPSSLPSTPAASVEVNATVMLLDVDPESPQRGTRHPIVVHPRDCATLFWAPHSLAVRPVYGVPLASSRTYAAVVTRGVRDSEGNAFVRDADLDAILGEGGDAAVVEARTAHASALATIEAAGIDRADIVSLAVFTTQDAIGETIAIRDWMVANYPAPTVRSASLVQQMPAFTELTGRYGPVPIFQEGTLPYAQEGGAIRLDASGNPTVHAEYDARFTLAVPTSTMPADGYPVILYAHGTGGDHRSIVTNALQRAIIASGFAAIGIDQIHHGERNPSTLDPAILFFNFSNPDAARDNNRQSALDVVQQSRLIAGLNLPTDLLERSGQQVRFNARQIFVMGHSQGGLNGPIFLGIDDSARGGVISAGSAIIAPALIDKLDPFPIAPLVVALLRLPGSDWQDAYAREGFTYEHPIATLVQTWVEAADAANYAHLVFDRPRIGPDGVAFAPKSVLMTDGLMDITSPPISIEALAGSMSVPLVEPVHAQVPSLTARDLSVFAPPVTGNVAGGRATAGLLQFPNGDHFVAFDEPAANAQILGFFASFRDGALPTIPAAR